MEFEESSLRESNHTKVPGNNVYSMTFTYIIKFEISQQVHIFSLLQRVDELAPIL